MLCLLEAKDAWYDWRSKLLPERKRVLTEHKEFFMRDIKYLEKYKSRFETIVKELDAYYAELSSSYANLTQR